MFFSRFIYLIASLTLTANFALGDSFDHSHSALTPLLESYVDENGLVDYASLKKNSKPLKLYLRSLHSISKDTFESWGEQKQIAFLINLYNAETLELIIDNYPVGGIKEVGGWFRSPWKLDEVILFGEKTTLDTIEHEILRKNYEEPGIHFALVCAAKSCPPLRREAYSGTHLNEQLSNQAQIFLSTPTKNHLDQKSNTLYLSKIFSWFEKDFLVNSSSISDFLTPYFPSDEREFIKKNKPRVRYTAYDWSLNSQ